MAVPKVRRSTGASSSSMSQFTDQQGMSLDSGLGMMDMQQQQQYEGQPQLQQYGQQQLQQYQGQQQPQQYGGQLPRQQLQGPSSTGQDEQDMRPPVKQLLAVAIHSKRLLNDMLQVPKLPSPQTQAPSPNPLTVEQQQTTLLPPMLPRADPVHVSRDLNYQSAPVRLESMFRNSNSNSTNSTPAHLLQSNHPPDQQSWSTRPLL
jgi:hypothetical protein